MDIRDAFQLLGVPDEVRRAYEAKGLRSLYAWQGDCLLTTNVLRGQSLLYCAPTSGGKTLVAELILLKTALVLKKKVIFILPYISLVLEKEKYLQKLVSAFNRANSPVDRIKVKAYYGGKVIKRGSRAQIMVCTIEKANSLINYMIQKGTYHEMGCIVVDEAHVISNSLNGYMLEILISKVKHLNSPCERGDLAKVRQLVDVQLIAMSATVGNVEDMSRWLQSKLYITSFRPVPLKEHIKAGKEIFDVKGEQLRLIQTCNLRDTEDVVSLCAEGVKLGQQILVFCPSKVACYVNCKLITELLSAYDVPIAEEYILSGREALATELLTAQIASGRDDKVLREAVLAGVAYHNSNLDQSERQIIEEAYKGGLIQILVATTTLAAGVNLPAGRVLITTLQLGRDPLSIGHYKQMIGRAGRAGQCQYGESFLLVKRHDLPKALDLVHQSLPNIVSALAPERDGGNAILRLIIEACGLHLVKSLGDAVRLVQHTLFYHLLPGTSSSKTEAINKIVSSAVDFLANGHILRVESRELADSSRIEMSRLGQAMMKSGIDIDEAIIIYDGLFQAQSGMILDSSLHLLTLIAPYNAPLIPNFAKLAKLYDSSSKSKKKTTAEVLKAVGISYEQLSRWIVRPPTRAEITECSDLMRFGFLKTFAKLCGSVLLVEAPDSIVDINAPARKPTNFTTLKALCATKRFWGALILQGILEGYKLPAVAKEYDCSAQDVMNLIRDARMKLQITRKLCDEMGWSTMSKMFKAFDSELKFSDQVQFRTLLAIPGMTHKMAKIFISYGIETVEAVAEQTPENISQYFILSIGFDLQSKDDVVADFMTDSPASISTLDGASDGTSDGTSDERPTKLARTENETLLMRMTQFAGAIIQEARKIVESKRSALATTTSTGGVATEETFDGFASAEEYEALLAMEATDVFTSKVTKSSKGAPSNDDNASEDVDEEEEDDEEDDLSSTPSDDLEIDEDEGDPLGDVEVVDEDVLVPQVDAVFDEDNEEEFWNELEGSVDLNTRLLSAVQSTSQSSTLMTKTSVERVVSVRISTQRKAKRGDEITDQQYLWDSFDLLVSESDLIQLLERVEADHGVAQTAVSKQISNDLSDNTGSVTSCTIDFERSHVHADATLSSPRSDTSALKIEMRLYPVLPQMELRPEVHVLLTDSGHLEPHGSLTMKNHMPEELDDETLLKMMEEWESAQQQQSKNSRRKSTDVNLASGISSSLSKRHNRNSSGSKVRFAQLVAGAEQAYPAAKSPANGQQSSVAAPHIRTEARPIRRHSPYLTPYGVSKAANVATPGTYLYWPASINQGNALTYGNSLQLPQGGGDTLFQLQTPGRLLQHCISKPHTMHDLRTVQVVPLSNPQYCREFLANLHAMKCFAFELIFRDVPHTLLHQKRSSGRLSRRTPFSYVVSEICSPVVNITSTLADMSLPNVLHLADPGHMKRKRGTSVLGGGSSNYVLSGIVFNCGGSQCYTLSLPLLPAKALATFESSTASYDVKGSYNWGQLPSHVMEKIAGFVGFGQLLSRSYPLRCFMRDGSWPAVETEAELIRQQQFFASPNALLWVSKNWSASAWRALVNAWRSGQSAEWQFINQIFSDLSTCKVSANMKNKLLCLRERDILPRGHLLDPALAYALLPIDATKKAEDEAVFALPRDILLHHSNSRNAAAGSTATSTALSRHTAFRIGALRAFLSLQSMNRAHQLLESHGVSELFYNIEMPLCSVLADMELHGVHADGLFLRTLKSSVEDRLRVIDGLVQHYCGSGGASSIATVYNLESPGDVRRLKQRLPVQPNNTIADRIFEAGDGLQMQVEESSATANPSDWSHGKTRTRNEDESGKQDQDNENDPQRFLDDTVEVEHLIINLVREHRRHVKLLPMIHSLLRSLRKERIHGYFHQLGTITGRMIASHPPLQQIPKEASLITSERMSLWQELRHAFRQQESSLLPQHAHDLRLGTVSPSWPPFVARINQSLARRRMNQEYEWVRFCPQPMASKFHCNTPSASSTSHAITKTDNVDLKTLTATFNISALHEILITGPSEHDAVGIIHGSSPQVNNNGAGSKSRSKETLRVPLTQLRRVNAAIQPSSAEIELIQELRTVDHQLQSLTRSKEPLSSVARQHQEDLWTRSQQYSEMHTRLYESINVRCAFTCAPGYVLLAADYSQIELRILAHLSQDPDLCAAFQSHQEDVFRVLASRWLQKETTSVTVPERNRIKQLCYALIYGAGPSLVAQQANVSVAEAETWFLDFAVSFPGISAFLVDVKAQARAQGFVRTLLGRVRSLPELLPPTTAKGQRSSMAAKQAVQQQQATGERRAVNTLCQGSAADLIKLAMININSRLEAWSRASASALSKDDVFHFRQPRSNPGAGFYKRYDDARLVLQIHDELVYEVKPAHVDKVARIVQECMEQAILLYVPLQVKLSVGDTWGSLQPYELPERTSFNMAGAAVSTTDALAAEMGFNDSNSNSTANSSSKDMATKAISSIVATSVPTRASILLKSPTDADLFPLYSLHHDDHHPHPSCNQPHVSTTSIRQETVTSSTTMVNGFPTLSPTSSKTTNNHRTIVKNLFGSE